MPKPIATIPPAGNGVTVVSPGFHPGSVPLLTVTTSIDLDITDGCNLACGYCFKKLDKPNHMSFEMARDAIEWLIVASKGSERIGINFMGGEPTLRFETIRRIVDWGARRARAAGKKASFSLTSNMTLWNQEIRDWVDQRNIGVLMSIDGLPEMQDSQRPAKDGTPKAGIVAGWARSMLRTRPRSDARLTTSPAWVHKLHESLLYLWDTLGFTNIIMADADYENWEQRHFDLYKDQNERIADTLFDDFASGGLRSIAVYSFYLKHMISVRDHGREPERKRFPCGAGYNYCMIDHRGDIWPCHRFDGAALDSGCRESVRLGNIHTGGYNEDLSNAFRNFDHFATAKPECASCPLDALCAGFCPAANLQHSRNTIYLPHPAYCRLKQILYPIVETLYFRMKAHDAERLARRIEGMNIGMVEV